MNTLELARRLASGEFRRNAAEVSRPDVPRAGAERWRTLGRTEGEVLKVLCTVEELEDVCATYGLTMEQLVAFNVVDPRRHRASNGRFWVCVRPSPRE